MNLQEFSFLADENIHSAVAAELRAMGCDVLDVCGSGLRGSADEDLLRLAVAENRVVVTHDKDFGALAIAQSEPLVGIVFLRPGHINPQFTIQTLRSLFRVNPQVSPPFILVAKQAGGAVTIRIRNL